ncbi:MAG: TolC family protein [Desulfatirhabdiaceae bacterium]
MYLIHVCLDDSGGCILLIFSAKGVTEFQLCTIPVDRVTNLSNFFSSGVALGTMRSYFIHFLLIILCVSGTWAGENMPPMNLTVSEAVSMAIQNNTAIRESAQKYLAANEDRLQARADFFPKAVAGYGYTSLEDQPYQKFGVNQVMVGGREQHHWDISLIQTVFRGFALVSRYDMARISQEIADMEHRQTIQDISAEVKKACYQALLSKKIEQVANETVLALSAHEAEADRFYRHGLIPYNDLLKARVARAAAIQEQEKVRASAKQIHSRLNILIGNPMDTGITIADTDEIVIPPTNLPALVERALRSRPVLAALRLGLEMQEQSIRMAESAYYPELNLIGRYEQNGQDILAQTNDYGNDFNMSVSLQARWTFFEWGKTRAATARQRYEQNAFQERLKSAEDRIRLETQQAFLDMGVSMANLNTSREAVDQARENYRITRLLYEQQIVNSTEVLDAQTARTQAETNYFQAVYGGLTAMTNLEWAIGQKID